MTNINDELKAFDIMPVAFLLQGNNAPFKFKIPSFQRGYRWEEKHVREMLDDFYAFVSQDEEKSYFLQPLVVRKGENAHEWEVLDGQQRLTTLMLILNKILPFVTALGVKCQIYNIEYIKRNTPDFEKLDPLRDLDSFYLLKAQKTIDKWWEEHNNEPSARLEIAKSLFFSDNSRKVKFIWYVVQEENDETSDLNAIKVFNRLNKGKISLTSSELIKALFYIKFKSTEGKNKLDVDRFSMEWDIMEKQFEKDDFWYFISDRKQEIGTRMDVLFDYVADVDYRKGDSMDSYRYFQKKFDNEKTTPGVFAQTWKDVKRVYDIFIRWYEDIRIYNYVGYLVWSGLLPQAIAQEVYHDNPQLDEDELLSALRCLIINKIKSKSYCEKTSRSFEEWEYGSDLPKIRQMLLLFNIETYNKANMKFPFDLFKKNHWDVEHVDSQKDNTMQELEHKMEWIKLVSEQFRYDSSDDAKKLLDDGEKLFKQFKDEGQDTNNAFGKYYSDVYKYYNNNDTENSIDKDTIDNLALLNCGINRSYKNAPFPCKRSIIIKNDEDGVFIPLCTRNLFLKYYTGANRGASQLDMIRWNDTDRTAYRNQLLETLKNYI